MNLKRLVCLIAATCSASCTSCKITCQPPDPTPQVFDFIDYFGGKKSASGIVFAGGAEASRWNLVNLTPNSAKNQWGGSTGSDEHWVWDDQYLYNPGWWGNGTYYQNVTTRTVLTMNGVETVLATSGPQIYALRKSNTSYKLVSDLVITEQSSGIVIHARHTQWFSPSYLSNNGYMTVQAVAMRETWEDDNQHPFALQLDRTVEYGRGVGPAYRVTQTFPTPWSAALKESTGV